MDSWGKDTTRRTHAAQFKPNQEAQFTPQRTEHSYLFCMHHLGDRQMD